jgi:hypothetical protein
MPSSNLIRYPPCWRRVQQDRNAAYVRNPDDMLNRHDRGFELAHNNRSLGNCVSCCINISRQQKIVGSGGDGDDVFTGGFT